jgi:mannose-6-phosphate isomerase-like protein (cupin superfamily)
MVVAGEQRILTAGDTYNVPAGAPHGVRVFEDPTELLAIWAPPLDDASTAAT